MTGIAWVASRRARYSGLMSLAGGTGWAVAATYRLGGRAWLAAPGLLAIAVLPELAQHAAEIELGMFESKAAFRAAADDPLRWAFGYPKLAGFVIAILGIARFWSVGTMREALLPSPSILVRTMLAVGLLLAAELPFDWLAERSSSAILDAILVGVSILVQGGLLVLLVGALLGDPRNSLRRVCIDRWPTAVLLTFLIALALVPAQALHTANHLAAFGQPASLVWALMIFDSLWVGLLAGLIGSALFVSHRSGPTWQGWSERPSRNWLSGERIRSVRRIQHATRM